VEISCLNPGREVFENLPDWQYNAHMQQDIKPDYPAFREKKRQFNVMVPGQRELLLEAFAFSDSRRNAADEEHTFELRIYASELPTPIVQHLSLTVVGKLGEID